MKRNPLARIPTPTAWNDANRAPTPLDTIPVARRKTRNRAWERENKGTTFRIPAPYVARAKIVREAIADIAQRHLATVDQVADSLLAWSIEQHKQGRVKLEAYPYRRKMVVRVVSDSGVTPALPQPKPPKKQKDAERYTLTYRLTEETKGALKALCGTEISPGQAATVLLEFALNALSSGQIGLTAEPEIVRQTVRVKW